MQTLPLSLIHLCVVCFNCEEELWLSVDAIEIQSWHSGRQKGTNVIAFLTICVLESVSLQMQNTFLQYLFFIQFKRFYMPLIQQTQKLNNVFSYC